MSNPFDDVDKLIDIENFLKSFLHNALSDEADLTNLELKVFFMTLNGLDAEQCARALSNKRKTCSRQNAQNLRRKAFNKVFKASEITKKFSFLGIFTQTRG